MNETIVTKAFELIEIISVKMGIISTEIYSIYTEQIFIYAMQKILFALFLIFVIYKFDKWVKKEDNEFKNLESTKSNKEIEDHQNALTMCSIFKYLGLAIIVLIINAAIGNLINPQYYSINLIIESFNIK